MGQCFQSTISTPKFWVQFPLKRMFNLTTVTSNIKLCLCQAKFKNKKICHYCRDGFFAPKRIKLESRFTITKNGKKYSLNFYFFFTFTLWEDKLWVFCSCLFAQEQINLFLHRHEKCKNKNPAFKNTSCNLQKMTDHSDRWLECVTRNPLFLGSIHSVSKSSILTSNVKQCLILLFLMYKNPNNTRWFEGKKKIF